MGPKTAKKRVVLIGPILPFRGGIAQHTTMLHRTIADGHSLLTLSFSRQYPKWLFPGASDRDPEYAGHEEPGVDYVIDSVNPLTWIRAVRRIVDFQPDIVVFPWWTIYWVPCFGVMVHRLRSHRLPIAFFCHNVVEHEAAAWKTALSRLVLRMGDRFVVHTHEDAVNLQALLPGSEVAIQAHPIYDQYPAPVGNLGARRPLELLFYGFVRPYKGLDLLIDALARLDDPSIQLTIAGEFWDGEDTILERIEQLGLSDRIEVLARYHSDQETAELFARADAVVLPYRSATGSGVVPVAYHYNKPVVVTRVGGLPDVVVDGETGLVVPANDAEALASALASLSREQCEGMRPAIEQFKKSLTWDALAGALIGEHSVPGAQAEVREVY